MTSKDPQGAELTSASLINLAESWGLPRLACIASTLSALALLLTMLGYDRLGYGALSGIFSLPLVLMLVVVLVLVFLGMILSSFFGMKFDRSRRVEVWFLPAVRLCAEYSIAVFAVCFTMVMAQASLQWISQVVISAIIIIFALVAYRTAVYLHTPWSSDNSDSGRSKLALMGIAFCAALLLIALVVLLNFSEGWIASMGANGANEGAQLDWPRWGRAVLALAGFVLVSRRIAVVSREG